MIYSMWIELFLIISTFLLIVYIFNYTMRKILKVDKRKLFSYSYVNDKHKKYYRIILIMYVVFMLSTPIVVALYPNVYEAGWKYSQSIIIIIFLIVTEINRAYMEWK